ncbi:MAG: AI-2E family transporter [Planctomycetes bacterium]|jgi:AI-2 transport protein TqsA|nr:AI-2E family transporter [Planctomycetota bacterium]
MINLRNQETNAGPEHSEQNWLITVSLAILAVVALAAALIYTRAIMMPFVVSLFIVALVSPIEDFQVKWLRLPRVIAVIVTLLVALSVITLVSLFVAEASRTIVYTANDYSASFETMAQRFLDQVEHLYPQEEPKPVASPNEPKPAPTPTPAPALTPAPEKATKGESTEKAQPSQAPPEAFELFPVVKDTVAPVILEARPRAAPPAKEPDQVVPAPTAAVTPVATVAAEPAAPPEEETKKKWRIDTQEIVKDLKNYIFNIVTNAFGTIFGMISRVVLVILFVIFLLAGRNPYAKHSQVYVDVVRRIRRYVGTKVLVSAAAGVLIWATFTILGLPLAGVFGVLAFLLRFIPSVGPTIATLIPLPIAVAQFHYAPWPIMLAVLIPGLIQSILGNLVEPKLMGEGLDLHPISVILALSFWGLLWGIVGMLLAAPITAALRIVLMQFDTFRPIADLLAGHFSKPAHPVGGGAAPAVNM